MKRVGLSKRFQLSDMVNIQHLSIFAPYVGGKLEARSLRNEFSNDG